jgi:hypothetical protein
MSPENVEQNRELLYKFPGRGDRHRGMNSVLVAIAGEFFPLIQQCRMLSDVFTTLISGPEVDLQDKCVSADSVIGI